MNKNNMIKLVLVVVGLLVLYHFTKKPRENFESKTEMVPEMNINTEEAVPQIAESEMIQERQERPDIEAKELLPLDENTIWNQVNPSVGNGTVSYKNFLEAGNMFGIDTQGSSLRNANQSLRSEPLIKQEEVSPWSQSTIDSDPYRRPLESSCRQ